MSINKGFSVQWHHDWDSFTRNVNWHDFTFIHLAAEWDPQMGRAELEIGLLGVGAVIAYVYNPNADRLTQLRAMREDAASISPEEYKRRQILYHENKIAKIRSTDAYVSSLPGSPPRTQP